MTEHIIRMLSRVQVHEIDARAAAEFGVPTLELMENAGRACAEKFAELFPNARRAAIYCGPGNNGGDGFVMARYLQSGGIEVAVHLDPNDRTRLAPDAAANFRRLGSIPVLPLSTNPPADAVLVDALFGIGLARPLNEPYLTAVNSMNAASQPTIAIDIPSGLDCDTGTPHGICVKAHHTLTFVAPKLGFANPHSREFTGEVHILDIRIPPNLLAGYH